MTFKVTKNQHVSGSTVGSHINQSWSEKAILCPNTQQIQSPQWKPVQLTVQLTAQLKHKASIINKATKTSATE